MVKSYCLSNAFVTKSFVLISLEKCENVMPRLLSRMPFSVTKSTGDDWGTSIVCQRHSK